MRWCEGYGFVTASPRCWVVGSGVGCLFALCQVRSRLLSYVPGAIVPGSIEG